MKIIRLTPDANSEPGRLWLTLSVDSASLTESARAMTTVPASLMRQEEMSRSVSMRLAASTLATAPAPATDSPLIATLSIFSAAWPYGK